MSTELDQYPDRPSSEQLADLHVFLVPVELWRDQTRSAVNEIITDTVSAGFVRFVNLKHQVRPKQEYQLKVKNFLPPQAYCPEIFVLEATSDVRSSLAFTGSGTSSARSEQVENQALRRSYNNSPFNPYQKVPPLRSGRYYNTSATQTDEDNLPVHRQHSPSPPPPPPHHGIHRHPPPHSPPPLRKTPYPSHPEGDPHNNIPDSGNSGDMPLPPLSASPPQTPGLQNGKKEEPQQDSHAQPENGDRQTPLSATPPHSPTAQQRSPQDKQYRSPKYTNNTSEDSGISEYGLDEAEQRRLEQILRKQKEDEQRRKELEDQRRAQEEAELQMRQQEADRRRWEAEEEARRQQEEAERKHWEEQQRWEEEEARRREEEMRRQETDRYEDQNKQWQEEENRLPSPPALTLQPDTADKDAINMESAHGDGTQNLSRSQTRTQSQAQNHSRSQSQAQAQSRSQSQAQPYSRSQSQAQPYSRSQSQAQALSRSQSQAQALSRSQSQAQGQSRSHSQAQSRSQSQAQAQNANQDHVEIDPEILEIPEEQLMEELEQAKEQRKDAEKQREELVKRAKQMQNKTQQKRTQARDVWKKKYFDEKKKTLPLEEETNKLRQELESLHRRIMSQLEGTKENRKIDPTKPSPQSNLKIQATKLQHEIEDLQRRLENIKLKLTAEMKLRNQAESELRALRAELTQKKINVTLTRSQQLQALGSSREVYASRTPVPGGTPR